MNIRHDPARQRFYVPLDAGEVFLEYRPRGKDTLEYVSTFVPPEHRHQGIGEAIVKHALGYARENGYRVVPTCPFVSQVIEENPEYQDLVRAV
jgi:predicted GNAT family acetyltransferase